MAAAPRTYGAAGFVDREPYEGAEVPKELWPHGRFMELSLRSGGCAMARVRVSRRA